MGVIIFLVIVGVIIYLIYKESDSSSSYGKTNNSQPYAVVYKPHYYNKDSKRIERWKRKRAEFEEQKKSDFFKDWKREQFYCQNKQCAWCRKPIDIHSPDTHVDHIKPLLWWGTNEYSNLLLACKECNEKKADSTVGWAGGKGIPGENSKPTWIKPNRCCRNFESKNIVVYSPNNTTSKGYSNVAERSFKF